MYVGSAPTSNPQGPHRPRFDEARGTRTGSAAASVNEQSPSVEDPAAVASGSSEMAVLLDRLRAIPEVRTGRLSQVGQRLERSTLFLQYLEGEKYKELVSVDECWVYLATCNGIRRIYYQFTGEETEES